MRNYKNLWELMAGVSKTYQYIGKKEHRELAKELPNLTEERLIAAGNDLAQNVATGELDEKEVMRFLYAGEFFLGTRQWGESAYPTFELTPDFFHAIALTHFGDALEEQLPVPFKAFVLRFPENNLLGSIKSAFTWHLPGQTHRNMTFAIDDLRVFHLLWEHAATPKEILDELKITAGLPPTQFAELVEGSLARSENPNLRADADRWKSLLVRIYVNTLTYINASGGLPREKAKQEAQAAPVERIHKDKPLYRIGRVVKLGPHIRAALTEAQPSTSWELKTKHIVRGHWRNQAHGPGHSLRRKQWIEPFWKGPKDLTEALERTYSVE